MIRFDFNLEEKLLFPKTKNFISSGAISSNIESSWKEGLEGKSIIVAIIDSGIKDHVDFKDRIIRHYNLTDEKEIKSNHGTHIAGIIAANGKMKGFAPKCRIVDIKIVTEKGGSFQNLKKALEIARNEKVHIVNMSFGSVSIDEFSRKQLQYEFQLMKKLGIVCIAASGNDGKTVCTVDKYLYPASLENVISVSSCHLNSNFKIILDSFSSENDKVDFVGMGGYVLSTIGNDYYGVASGTSMATPHISGFIAILYEKQLLRSKIINMETLENDLFRNIVKINNCQNLYPNISFGYGFPSFIGNDNNIIYKKPIIINSKIVAFQF